MEPGEEISFFDQVNFVKSFCYSEDRLNGSGGSEEAVTARTIIGLIKFRECGQLLYGRNISFKMKGFVRVAKDQQCYMGVRQGVRGRMRWQF